MDKSFLSDKRQIRAQQLTAHIMSIVEKYILGPDRHTLHRKCANELFDAIFNAGAEIITDYTRAQLGLPPRGKNGWTDDEILVMEQRYLDLLRAPSFVAIKQNDFDH